MRGRVGTDGFNPRATHATCDPVKKTISLTDLHLEY